MTSFGVSALMLSQSPKQWYFSGGSSSGVLRWRSERDLESDARELLERLGLAALAARPCAGLPYGTLKRIELARALASEPKLLLLDEPANGLTHGEVDELAALIRSLRDEHKISVLLVEHHMGMVMAISDHIVVMEFGQRIASGTPAEIREDPRVIAAYLGGTIA